MPERADKDLQLEVLAKECSLTLRAACFSLHLICTIDFNFVRYVGVTQDLNL